MSVSNGKVSATAPIGLAEICQLLGVSSLDVGSACTSNNIKKWAKYKPVRVNTVAEIDLAQRRAVNYGISVTTYSSGTTWYNNRGASIWNYLKPWGANSSIDYPYRLTDFLGYNHNAPSPLPSLAADTVLTGNTAATPVVISAVKIPFLTDEDDCLQQSDFAFGGVALEDMYLGIAITQNNVTQFVTDTAKGLNRLPTVKFSTLPSGTYKALLFASSIIVSPAATVTNNGIFIGLDQFDLVDLTFQKMSNTWKISVQGSYSSKGAVTASVSISSELALSLTGMTLYVLSSSTAPTSSTSSNIIGSKVLNTNGSITLSANGTYSESVMIKSLTSTPNMVWLYVVSTTNGLWNTYNSGTPVGAISTS